MVLKKKSIVALVKIIIIKNNIGIGKAANYKSFINSEDALDKIYDEN